MLAALVGACGGPADRPRSGDALDRVASHAVQRAALTTLFLERERAGELVLWRGPLDEAPTLPLVPSAEREAMPLASAVPADAADSAVARALALPIAVRTVSHGELEAHFRAHPDAWKAWFARHPRSSGVVELTRPRRVWAIRGGGADGVERASLLVGRACGEHCRMAWHVVVRRDPAGAWRTESVRALRLPRS